MNEWRIIQGDALEVLRTLEDESVQCCVTSPPYWGLRDYGVGGQIGLDLSTEYLRLAIERLELHRIREWQQGKRQQARRDTYDDMPLFAKGK